MTPKEKIRRRRRITAIALLFAAVIIIFLIGCCTGRYAVPVPEVFRTLAGGGSAKARLAIIDFRLPRVCLAVLVGIGMGTSGVIMQSLLHNDLASPGTLGVADGSSLFMLLYVGLLQGKIENPVLLPILALFGGMLAAVIIYLLSTKKNKPISSVKLVMTGVAMGAGFSAVSTFMMYVLDESQLEFVQRWQSGELWGTEWTYILILFVWLLVFCGLAMYFARVLNAIALGNDLATGLGVNMHVMFPFLAFLAVGMSSASVAFGGNFFFLGLIGPHIARRMVGTDARYLLPAAGAVSALIITASNILVENVSLLTNVPTGIFVSILSVPYFLYLLIKSR
ncbi:MAG: iron ABC transporter permease [Eubacterium sp.]|nr:iron ABC transporter permease [Eubacterium sp.]